MAGDSYLTTVRKAMPWAGGKGGGSSGDARPCHGQVGRGGCSSGMKGHAMGRWEGEGCSSGDARPCHGQVGRSVYLGIPALILGAVQGQQGQQAGGMESGQGSHRTGA